MLHILIVFAMSLTCFIYAYLAYNEKVPLLSNTYLYASKKEREEMDKTREYKFVSKIFGLLGLAFLFLGLEYLFNVTLFRIIFFIIIGITILYAIIDCAKSFKK